MADAQSNQSPGTVNVALCIDADVLDRWERVLRYLIIGLVDQAIQVQLVSTDVDIESLALGPVQAMRHEPLRWPMTGRRTRQLLDGLSSFSPNVVHAFSARSHGAGAAIAGEFDIDLILQITALAERDLIARLDQRSISKFITGSEPLSTMLEKQLHVSASAIELIRPGLFASDSPSCFAQADRTPTLVCTADFDHQGVTAFVEAIQLLHRAGHSFLVFLLGEGRHEHDLRAMVHAKRLSSIVTFARPAGDIAPATESGDIFVHPVADEALTLNTLRAMASGMCVVAFRSAVCDHLHDGETAVVCPAPAAEPLAACIERLLKDRDEARRIAGRGLTYVREHHSASLMAEKTAAVYRTLTLSQATFPLRP